LTPHQNIDRLGSAASSFLSAGRIGSGASDAGIAAILNRCGKCTGKGNSWTESRVRSHPGSWIGREAPAKRVEIGQSAGIEFSVNGFGELGLAAPIVSEGQQPDHGAARLLLAATGQQRLEGALIGAARADVCRELGLEMTYEAPLSRATIDLDQSTDCTATKPT
jgi:hypothetical protein